MNQREQAIATKTYEVYTDKYSCIVQAESIQDALETFAAYYRRDETDEVWAVEDVAMREEDRKSAAALSEPGGEAPTSYAMSRDYEALWEALKYRDVIIRITILKTDSWQLADASSLGCTRGKEDCFKEWAAVKLEWIAPLSADRIMEVVEAGKTHYIANEPDWIVVSRSDLRSRLSSELGLK